MVDVLEQTTDPSQQIASYNFAASSTYGQTALEASEGCAGVVSWALDVCRCFHRVSEERPVQAYSW